MSLHISSNLDLPDEAVTQTFAILAKRGVGKTYTASVMVEEMLKASLHVVVVDPIGVWWGLRSSADGKSAGLPIIIAGGEHADVPIEPTSGEVLAELIVEQRVSMVIDLSLFRKGEQHRFMIDFAETLYRKNRQALHLVLDEADEFAPQRTLGDEARMLGAIEDLVRRGRARGIGVTMITQRPAVLNKNVLTQIEVLVALRLTSPQDRAAIAEWVKYHADAAEAQKMLESLGSLPVGTAWFWSPGWLGLFKKVAVRQRETLDSSSTPKVGERVVEAQKMAAVDLAKLREQLATTIDKVESEDPKVLRRRIAELEKQLEHPQIEVRYDVPDHIRTVVEMILNDYEMMGEHIAMYRKYINEPSIKRATVYKPDVDPHEKMDTRRHEGMPKVKVDQEGVSKLAEMIEGPKITGGARRILEVLVSYYPMTFTRGQLATLSKLSPRSGTYGTYLSTLRSSGLILQEDNTISVTDDGRKLFGDVRPRAQTSDEVIDMWLNSLPGGAKRMLNVLVGAYPSYITREQLGEATELASTSGTFGAYLSMLRGNGLVEVNGREFRASENLFMGVSDD